MITDTAVFMLLIVDRRMVLRYDSKINRKLTIYLE
jgi:hypothetical protein